MSNLRLIIKGNNCLIKIDNDTTSNGTSIYCIGNENKITVGRDCMFAAHTEIWSSDSHIITNNTGTPLNCFKHIVQIGNHVWLAEHAKVLKGVHVADNCILGMGCILTKDTSPNSIYAGIPGKKIKCDINWKRDFPIK